MSTPATTLRKLAAGNYVFDFQGYRVQLLQNEDGRAWNWSLHDPEAILVHGRPYFPEILNGAERLGTDWLTRTEARACAQRYVECYAEDLTLRLAHSRIELAEAFPQAQ